MTQIVPFTPGDPDNSLPAPSRPRAWLEQQRRLPSPTRLRQSLGWWCTSGLGGLVTQLVRLPFIAMAELRPILRGLGRILSAWSSWCAVAEYTAAAKTSEDSAKHLKEITARRSANRKLSFFGFLLLCGAGIWAYSNYRTYLAVAGIAFVGICDLVGRAGQEKETPLPPPLRTVLREGVPLSQITGAILDTCLREGLEVGVAEYLRYDADRREYSIVLSCRDQITADHLRAIERGIGADDHTIRNLATGISTNRRLIIRDGDPLANLAERPFLPTGSVSITEPLELGMSMTEVPFALTFAGQHMKVVGATGSGKTRWFLRACIDAVSATRAVIGGIDLTNNDEFPLWKGVIQEVAYTPETAETFLDKVLAEIDRRMKILAAFAEDDDPTNDLDEWCEQLGPAWVIFADEFHLIAPYDGKGGKPDLLGKCEQIVRVGRKVWVSMVMLTQKTGNSDFGSQTMSSQCSTAVMLSCDAADTVRMVGVERRDMGYAPHLLAPGVKGDIRDAGKAYLDSPAHRTPDIYRAFAPGSNAEVKRRARVRMEDGLPSLRSGTHSAPEVVEAAEVPPVLVAVERAFSDAGDPEWLATADLLPRVRAMGFPELTETTLAKGIPVDKNQPGSRRRRNKGENPVNGYLLASIRQALDEL